MEYDKAIHGSPADRLAALLSEGLILSPFTIHARWCRNPQTSRCTPILPLLAYSSSCVLSCTVRQGGNLFNESTGSGWLPSSFTRRCDPPHLSDYSSEFRSQLSTMLELKVSPQVKIGRRACNLHVVHPSHPPTHTDGEVTDSCKGLHYELITLLTGVTVSVARNQNLSRKARARQLRSRASSLPCKRPEDGLVGCETRYLCCTGFFVPRAD